jgi:hypothetical protein
MKDDNYLLVVCEQRSDRFAILDVIEKKEINDYIKVYKDFFVNKYKNSPSIELIDITEEILTDEKYDIRCKFKAKGEKYENLNDSYDEWINVFYFEKFQGLNNFKNKDLSLDNSELNNENESEKIIEIERLHPELYSYNDDKKSWIERFIDYGARTQEWDLIGDDEFYGCYSFPLFTEEFCKMIREEAEFSGKWTTERHAAYPTNDMLIESIGLEDIYTEIIEEYILSFAIYKFHLDFSHLKNFYSENFLARYNTKQQGHLSIHHDESGVTALVQLSDFKDYEGGGTWFTNQKKLIKNPVGYCTIHPGKFTHRHGGRPIKSGSRYILVSFININS